MISSSFRYASEVLEIDPSYFSKLHKRLELARTKTAEEVYSLVSSQTSSIHGPHKVTLVWLNINGECRLLVVIGEIHSNPKGCLKGQPQVTVTNVVTEAMIQTPNLYLVLESFFHLVVENLQHALKLVRDLKKQHSSTQSMWQALRCLGGTGRCSTGSGDIGELIVLRAWAFAVQVAAAVLANDGYAEQDTLIFNLANRILFFDCREDLNLVPYDWIPESQDKDAFISDMLQYAKAHIGEFTPRVRSNHLLRAFTKYVKDPTFKRMDDCTASPSRAAYEDLFTEITEVVSVPTILSVIERDPKAHFVVVAGDRHRELIVSYLEKCLGNSVVNVTTVEGTSDSCVQLR